MSQIQSQMPYPAVDILYVFSSCQLWWLWIIVNETQISGPRAMTEKTTNTQKNLQKMPVHRTLCPNTSRENLREKKTAVENFG